MNWESGMLFRDLLKDAKENCADCARRARECEAMSDNQGAAFWHGRAADEALRVSRLLTLNISEE